MTPKFHIKRKIHYFLDILNQASLNLSQETAI